MNFTARDKVAESNRIEGILRPPADAEIAEFHRFIALPSITIDELTRFVSVYQPDAELRRAHGMDVRIGNYLPPRGGLHIPYKLDELLDAANKRNREQAWAIHCAYEDLHPFTDGNGRSGRMLWYWMMEPSRMADLGFLHAFYYQTLQHRSEGVRHLI